MTYLMIKCQKTMVLLLAAAAAAVWMLFFFFLRTREDELKSSRNCIEYFY